MINLCDSENESPAKKRIKIVEKSPFDYLTPKSSLHQQLSEIDRENVKRNLFSSYSSSKFHLEMIELNHLIK